jgi:hypothetical protein
MTTDAELTVSEREAWAETVRALEAQAVELRAEAAALRTELEWTNVILEGTGEAMWQEAGRAARYRSRLARVLRLAQADRLFVGIPDGAVWSRRALSASSPTKAEETTT